MKSPQTPSYKGMFGAASNFQDRLIPNYQRLGKIVAHLRGLGLKIVLTQGAYDMVHVGHARYLEEAKRHGDILIVGVDSDKKVKARKGPERPVVPEAERLEMLTHLRPVDLVVCKPLEAKKWELIKIVRPDVLIATGDTYSKKSLKEVSRYCGKVVVLERMATTTTSAKIRLLQIGTAKYLGQALTPRLIKTIQDVMDEVKGK
ncbi:MAG: hypothetical protein A3C06_04450 [Candidatus Taylorbacteria bacterium RIFCSPHIGHO2_02_FULL_46_13]|uniref:Cytidyltransferase-like domain-containing protein n=1 Tax=Candidatus Taylorbacteria bacterium RIFCSPHIGHO2_02_FULL_46_13 TaxID=1802312 RepID=A0A1G2MUN6_9BACT|nr:MAG: hypothetical protein A3C06_04450 [Candidatus Taylorbacteria bacterium RIFCSPHIGHO2_02_FULL_46_13]